MKLNPDSLPRHLAQQLLPVYLISGDEPLLAAEAADAVRARARARGFTEREVLFLDRGADWDAVRASVGSLSLFAERRIIELRLPSGKPGVSGGRALVSTIEALAGDVLLLILTGRLDRDAQSAEWVRAADARGALVPVWPIAPERMVGWLEARCRRFGLQLEPQALKLLADRTEGNLLAAHQELEKLKLLDTGAPVSEAQVLASSSASARFDVSGLTQALLAADCARALSILDGLRAEGVELPLVLWAVLRALREITGTGGRTGRRPSAQALLARAARADAMAKGRSWGNAWDEVALLATELCGRPALPLPFAPAARSA